MKGAVVGCALVSVMVAAGCAGGSSVAARGNEPEGDTSEAGASGGAGAPGDEERLAPSGWTLRDATPYARRDADVVVDSVGDRLILLGDGGAWLMPLSGEGQGTWTHTSLSGPSRLDGTFYDERRNRLFAVVGDIVGAPADSQIWVLSLTEELAWHRVWGQDGELPAGSSPPSFWTIDLQAERVIALRDDGVWTLDIGTGQDWRRRAPTPPERSSVLSFDTTKNRLLAFGQSTTVWQLPSDSDSWTPIKTPFYQLWTRPQLDQQAERLVFNDDEGALAVFSLRDDTFEFLTTEAPVAIHHAGRALDTQHHRVLYFSSLEGNNAVLSLSFDSLDWSIAYANTYGELLDPNSNVVWDASRQQVLGRGVGGSTVARDLSASSTWQPLAVEAADFGYPTTLAVDTQGQPLLSWGTDTSLVYRLSQGRPTWEPLGVEERPSNLSAAYTTFDAAGRRLIVYATPANLGSREDAWILQLGSRPDWTRVPTHGVGPEYPAGAVYDAANDRLLVLSVPLSAFGDATVYALSLSSEAEWTALRTDGNSPPPTPKSLVTYDASQQRIIMVTGDGEVFALSLGEQPTWHRFCSREDNVPRGEAHDAIQTPDGLFVVTRAGNYRFDLSTPYCD